MLISRLGAAHRAMDGLEGKHSNNINQGIPLPWGAFLTAASLIRDEALYEIDE